MTSAPITIAELADLREPSVVLDLVERARLADGFAAVNEAGRIALAPGRPSDPGRRHLLAGSVDRPLGYAALELPAAEGPRSAVGAEIVVDPAARGRGIGTALLAAAGDVAARERPGVPLAVWAHHDSPAARRLATGAGMTVSRVLLLLERAPAPLPAVDLPAGVRLAEFRPGTDEQAWLAVNAAAFAFHPEQGAWTLADLTARESEDWFDPTGFLLAWPVGHHGPDGADHQQLLGFNWTKVPTETPGTPIGEIYVLAVAPGAGVRGLGTALAVAGLEHLHGRGIDTVELYVEADNERALRLYRRLGFAERSRDVRWTLAPAAGHEAAGG